MKKTFYLSSAACWSIIYKAVFSSVFSSVSLHKINLESHCPITFSKGNCCFEIVEVFSWVFNNQLCWLIGLSEPSKTGFFHFFYFCVIKSLFLQNKLFTEIKSPIVLYSFASVFLSNCEKSGLWIIFENFFLLIGWFNAFITRDCEGFW